METKFKLGQIVYLKTDPEQYDRIITGYIIRPKEILYYLSCGTQETQHFDIEISAEKNIIMNFTNN